MEKKEKILRNLDRFTARFLPLNTAELLLISNGIFYLLNFIAVSSMRINLIRYTGFVRGPILSGEIWRVITYVFSFRGDMSFQGLLFSAFTFMIFSSAMGAVARAGGLRRVTTVLFIMYSAVTLQGFITGYADFSQVFHALILIGGLMDPTFGINFYFVIPIRGRILSLIYGVVLISGIVGGNYSSLAVLIVIILIYGDSIIEAASLRRIRTHNTYINKSNQMSNKKTPKHRCAVCGKTDISHPDMTFRYCSKCEGAFEYCEDHIKNHEHRSNIVKFK